ncbi:MULTISPECIES: HAD-IIB family hydrolase [Lachnospiraceae]|uniref:HAD family hydrolase n=1 Tax=Faecalicatena acetigenes TaxID=2981790 RepID=A0ABT2TCJ4_9FIRM|nr:MULTISPECIES: HAD-IIB family hydrolase [Lachnospiraceae]MCU6747988.1 HAD family hydrolase [Faecalicatena acetigenes]RGT72397.1 HAD-IIB family hydrolase [Ruminococcus sp. AF18-22]SCI21025.1 Uncharacterized phosphatase YwpJ [uncultured Clostridium sp.]
MKTLYVSDLDGTLFNSKKEISARSVELLNGCIERGMLFSVATARMPYGCDYRLDALKMSTPGILTNGVFIYDFRNREFLHAEMIPRQAAEKVTEAFQRCGLECFMYILTGNRIRLYYGSEKLKEQTQYYSNRALEECEEVAYTKDYRAEMDKGGVFYFALTGNQEELTPVKEEIEKISGVSIAFYLNIYNGMYCMEIFSEKASKKNALLRLKEMVGCEELVVFGDNYNDVPMIEIADRSYAPENALEEIKQMVTGVLPDCDHDGVAEFLNNEQRM